jgi:SAM-dependent methyltransferase
MLLIVGSATGHVTCDPSTIAAMTPSDASPLHRFQSAAPYYLTGRPGYSPWLIRRVALLCGLTGTHRILDLGCGPGPLAVAFAPLVAEVVAIDPEPAMLRAAMEHAARAGVAVRFIQGSSDDLGPELGEFRLVTIGRAFHWMDRVRTLERLEERIEPEGAIALFGDRHPNVPENAWRESYRELLEGYQVDDAGRAARRSPDWPGHEAVLLDSPFNRLERIGVIERQRTPIEVLVARAFSLSSTAPGRLGSRAEELARGIRELMAPHAVEGGVAEVIETEALIARRTFRAPYSNQ